MICAVRIEVVSPSTTFEPLDSVRSKEDIRTVAKASFVHEDLGSWRSSFFALLYPDI